MVVYTKSGPSTSRAANAVSSFILLAGITGRFGLIDVILCPSTDTIRHDCSGKFRSVSESDRTRPPMRISVERIAGKRRALSNDAFGDTT